MNVLGAVVASVGSAMAYGLASVLQHRTARTAPPGKGLRLGLLAHLAAQPLWIVGLVAAGAAFGLHVVALSLGELALVQPLLVSGLLFALPAAVLLEHRRPSLAEWSWALVLVGGLGLFLVSANPTVGLVPTDTDRLGALVIAGTILAGGLVLLGQRNVGPHGAGLLGFAAGILDGLTASLIKEVTALATSGPAQLIAAWPLYSLLGIGVAALVLNQAAYQAGPLGASLPPMTLANPCVAIVVGVLVFDEHIVHTSGAVLQEAVAAVAVALATMQLARFSAGQRHIPFPKSLRRGAE